MADYNIDDQVQCSLHGALIVQALLQYHDTTVISNSILSIPIDQLLSISCDPCGNHIIDAFLSSKNVLLKKKTKLIKKFTVRLLSYMIQFKICPQMFPIYVLLSMTIIWKGSYCKYHQAYHAEKTTTFIYMTSSYDLVFRHSYLQNELDSAYY